MAKLTKINHVAIVVSDIEESLKFWRDAMGIDLHHVEDVPSQKAMVAFLPLGDSEVELVNPPLMIPAWRNSSRKRAVGCITSASRWTISPRNSRS